MNELQKLLENAGVRPMRAGYSITETDAYSGEGYVSGKSANGSNDVDTIKRAIEAIRDLIERQPSPHPIYEYDDVLNDLQAMIGEPGHPGL